MIALCIGHSRMTGARREGGATAADGHTTERDYNLKLGRLLADLLSGHGIRAVVVAEYQGRGYAAAMTWLANHLETLGARLAVELHFNAADGRASGHEWLYWAGSKAGLAMATDLHLAMRVAFPGHPARGCKGLGPSHRGAEFLRRTHCPAAIAEPFFGDHHGDWRRFGAPAGAAALAAAMAAGLAATCRRLHPTP